MEKNELELKLAMTAQVITPPLCWSKSECWGWRGAHHVVMSETACRTVSNSIEACLLLQWLDAVVPSVI